LIYLLNRSIILFLQHKGNKARAKVLKWIADYIPLPFVYASSFINNRKGIKQGTYYIRRKEIICLEIATFEDMEVFIPIGWDSYLRRRYGDYMVPPPIEKQMGHHGMDIPDPFTPCNHSQILFWKDRKLSHLIRV